MALTRNYYQRNSSWNAPYTFSGKEKDVETAYGYIGARYYDSGLSIWLSVDPMSDKYPSMSPYNYCANNPVILVDPDGRDYETIIDEIAGTITIVAVYYTKNENKQRLQESLDVWNDQSGKYKVEVGEGDNKKEYIVNFKLTIDEGDYETNTDAQKAMPIKRGNSNYFAINDAACNAQNKTNSICDAYTSDGHSITSRTKNILLGTDIHEIGHTLGIGEGQNGVMEQGTNSVRIMKNHVATILENSGANLSYDSWGSSPTNPAPKTNRIQLEGTFKRNFRRKK